MRQRRDWWLASGAAAIALAIPAMAQQGGVFRVGNGVSAPAVLFKSDPQYTDRARNAHLEGTVPLEVVVETDGKAHDIKVIRSLDPDLDANAIEAVKQWRFKPGLKGGVPVDVRATVEMNFRLLRDKDPK